MAEFLLYKVPNGKPLIGDLTIELELEIKEWPDDWAYLVAKHASQQLHEVLIRLRGNEQGRFGYGDGSDHFNALKFSLADVINLHQRFTLKAVRSLHGESSVWVNDKLIAKGKYSPYHTPARTHALLSVGGDDFAGHKLNAVFYRLQIWQGAESPSVLNDSREREVSLQQVYPSVEQDNGGSND